jgi:hypothetical protein
MPLFEALWYVIQNRLSQDRYCLKILEEMVKAERSKNWKAELGPI